VKRVYFQPQTDDGGFASEGWLPSGDSAAVMPASEFVEVLRTASAPSDVATIRRGSMTSVPAVPTALYTDTQIPSIVHPLSVYPLITQKRDTTTEVSA
jgi:hypothetical protein